ncbi:hypothetical protein EBU02_06575 [bacterium]|nr:hypothetical protein [bacterium]
MHEQVPLAVWLNSKVMLPVMVVAKLGADESEGSIPNGREAACFWILGEEHSASRLCVLACSLVPIGMGESKRPFLHTAETDMPSFCGSKSNFKDTMV